MLMKPAFIILVLLLVSFTPKAQDIQNDLLPESRKFIPSEKNILHQLGSKEMYLKLEQYGNSTDLVFINLHSDESTSVEAARYILETEGGLLIKVENNHRRNISFYLNRRLYAADPNRIFTKEGILQTFTQLGKGSSPGAVDEVEKLGQLIISLIPENAQCVIALHNNTPDLFSSVSYTPGNKNDRESAKVFINPGQDADDFFLTTDAFLYEELAGYGYNTILQDNKNCTENGSLSVFCGKRNIRYVNCETEHGKKDQYLEMMKALVLALSKSSRRIPAQ
jgi:hypothetical protein